MGGSKKITAKKRLLSKPFTVILGSIVLLLCLFFVWQYFINRPNYRDLKEEHSKLVIPSDWKFVNESSNKGTWGLFCWQIEGSECPYLGYQYSTDNPQDPEVDKAIINKIIAAANYSVADKNFKHCVLGDENYQCEIIGEKDDVSLELSIGADGHSKILRIHLGQNGGR
ncbi:MAG: hypothetical protein M0R39_17725 [Prolixibacteraceae bacterium]|nr:hypothetical protein [Prolixibacteraceae bacterium]